MEKQMKESSNKIMQFVTAKWISQPLYVVTKLGIADILSKGSKSINELAEITGSHSPYLYRVMRALASMGIFTETESRVFGLTPMAECLQENKMKSIVLMFLSDWHNRAWENLFHSVKTGEAGFDSEFGMPFFQWLEGKSEEAKIFNEANSIKAMSVHSAVMELYDFSNFNSVTDIGGGYGGLLFSIMESNKEVKGVIADLPYMSSRVKEKIDHHNFSERCEFMSCNFFESIPGDSDCYILSNILHDWEDDKCKTILKNCHDAIGKESRLLIIEYIIPEGNEFSMAKLLDLEVMVMGGGRERTEKEFRELTDSSGFMIKNITKTDDGIALLECERN